MNAPGLRRSGGTPQQRIAQIDEINFSVVRAFESNTCRSTEVDSGVDSMRLRRTAKTMNTNALASATGVVASAKSIAGWMAIAISSRARTTAKNSTVLHWEVTNK